MRDGIDNPRNLTPDDVFGMEPPGPEPEPREDDDFDYDWPDVEDYWP